LVLNEVSDGYWAFQKIEEESRALSARCGLAVKSEAVADALRDLVKGGLVKAVWLSTREPPREIDGMPAETDIPRVYFFQTEEGVRTNAASFWPFDDQGQLLPGLSFHPGPRVS
jgi:hypothetical protein